MNRCFAFTLPLALVCGSAFGADQTPQATPKPSGKNEFQVTAKFSEAENVVEELTGTPVADAESQARLMAARAVFQAAVDQFPDTTLALNFLARTYAFPGQDTATAISTFEKSLAIDADQPDAVARLVDACLDAGKRAKAGEVQARYVKPGSDPALAAKVAGLIAKWDCTEGQRLVKEGHAEEGFALMDKAIQECTDRGLQANLRDKRNTVAEEWEVTQYNSALEKAKAGDYRGSYAILDKLVPVAKNPEVLERAKRLRDKIAPAVHPPSQ